MVFRVNKTDDYTVMSNAHLREREMSLKAKGLLSLMLSLPDDWDYTIAGLAAINKENESAIKGALNELRGFGYLRVTKKFPNETATGRFEYVYDVYEQPQEKQGVEIQGVEIQGVENHGQLNTNIQNTEEQNTNYKKEFDELWAAYPRKQGKSNALKAYTKARKSGVTFQAVLDGIEAYKAYLRQNKVKEQYIKHGSTFFNQACWNDDYGAAPRDTELDDIF